jgi:catechol 2,3-dioxygenase-like lactoylglutathione lyase family enzyme
MGETARLTGKGLRIIFSIEGDGWIGENYLDTGRHGGLWLSMRPPKDRWFSAWEAERLSNRLVSNWKFHGAGIAVRDLDQTVDYYRSLEIAAFQTERVFDSSSTADFQPGGKSAGSRFRARKRAAMLGSTVYEFVQPLEGDTIYSQALYSRGEGVNDIGFLVNDLDMEAAKLVGKGLPVVLSGKPSEGHAFAFFDTRPEGGNIMLKLMQA